MNVKLTLSIDQKTIGKAKKFAKERHASLSSMVGKYLEAVTVEEPETSGTTPLVTELSGIIGAGTAQNQRKEYASYLTDKYR